LEIAYAILIVTFYAYFMCVVERYYDLMKPAKKDDESNASKSGK